MKKRLLFFVIAYTSLMVTGSAQESGYYTDNRDGEQYKYITIGEQVWMTENMSYITSEGSSVYYHGISDPDTVQNNENFGRLYSFETALTVCPDGWHLPSDQEWTTLIEFLGGGIEAGGKMKTDGTTDDIGLWNPPNKNATNESGFSAVPGGYQNSDGNYTASEHYGIYWSSTENGAYKVWCREFTYRHGEVNRFPKNNQHANSARCLKDKE